MKMDFMRNNSLWNGLQNKYMKIYVSFQHVAYIFDKVRTVLEIAYNLIIMNDFSETVSIIEQFWKMLWYIQNKFH